MKAAIVLALAMALAAGAPALAQQAPAAPNRFAASIAPAERFEVAGMLVERHGNQGRPVVLIPGLASGSWVWQDLIRRLMNENKDGHKDARTLYVVTLPGFDGRPAPAGASFAAARAALVELVNKRRLARPVLVGHSMGGALALAVAQDLPDAVAGVISVDGLPVFPGTEDLPPAQRPQLAAGIRARLDAAAPGVYAEQQRQYMRSQGVVDMGKADDLAALALRSDRGAVGSYMADVFALDLRPALPKIAAPVLVLVPYFEPDASQDQVSSALKVEHYRRLMAGTPKLAVKPIANARHFLMIDQPEALADAVRGFLHHP